jgi:hypothetical protein
MPKTNNAVNNLFDDEEGDDVVENLEFTLDQGQENKNDKNEKNKDIAVEKNEDGVIISKGKLAIIRSLLSNVKENNEKLIQLLSGFVSPEEEARIGIGQMSDDSFIMPKDEEVEVEGSIIEGVFDGENMIGPDGKQYSVPANYASKSKLIEGDILKLTITPNGTFVYKQIGPIERRRLVGILEQSPNGNYIANTEEKKYRLLTASVTYFKGHAGDEAVILVPKSGDTKWAAVENIVRQPV